MYTYHTDTGLMVRDSDGVVVQPVVDQVAYEEYATWIQNGGQPLETGVVIIPQSVTPRQIRLALTQLGLRTAVEQAVAASTQDVKDTWEFSTECRIDDPLVIQFGQMLGINLNALFILADTL